MSRRVCLLLMGLFALLPGCESLGLSSWMPSTDTLLFFVPIRELEPEVRGNSLALLAHDGKTYYDVKALAIARSWLTYLRHLGLDGTIVEGTSLMVTSATPDGHRFTITVMPIETPLGLEPGLVAPQFKAYLSWAERDYSVRGWQLLTDLENQHAAPAK